MFRVLKNKHVRELWSPERRRARLALFFMGMRGLLALALPYYVGKTIAAIQARESRDLVIHYVTLLLLYALGTAFSQFWMRWLFIRSSRSFEERLRNRVFNHLSSLSFSYFNRVRTGDVMSRLTADVEAVRMGVGPGVMHMLQTGSMAIGAVAFMLLSNPLLTLATLSPMAVMFLMIRRTMPRLHKASLRVQEQLSTLSSLAQESFSGSRVVKAFAREDYEIHRFDQQAHRYIDDSMDMAMTRGRMHVFIELISALVAVALLFFGGRGVIEGTFSLDHFIAFFGYFTMLVWPMIAMGWTLALFERAGVAMDRLEGVLAEKPEIADGDVENATLTGDWQVTSLSYRHEGQDENVLQDISLRIPAGKSLAIVGPTGCGKTTLVQLFGRLLDPPPGTVFQDGMDVRRLKLNELRRSIAMVPQETFLFSDTLQANIAFGSEDEECPPEEIKRAARAAQIDEAIASFPDGYAQLIGERGITLSGGQKQRIAIARALVHPAPTLILDDCLSAVDTRTEEKILQHLRANTRQTMIVVAHRLSSVMHCDHIVVLKEGRIIEQGSHEVLAAGGGWYATTLKRQLLKKEIDAA